LIAFWNLKGHVYNQGIPFWTHDSRTLVLLSSKYKILMEWFFTCVCNYA
jgi:hypothetical protein